MDENRNLTKKERKELRKLEWQEKAKVEQRNAKIKKYSIWVGAVLVIILTIVGLIWLVTTPTPQTSNIKVAAISEKDITNEQKNAKVQLIEYSDFQCPACASYAPLVKQLLNDYKGKIYFAYRFFPLTGIHKNAIISSRAGYAAYKQNKFFEMADVLFTNQKDWQDLPDPRSQFVEYAKKIGLDTKKFEQDMNSDEAKKVVKDAESEAISAGINATPTFFVNGSKINNPGTYEQFKKIIDEELGKE